MLQITSQKSFNQLSGQINSNVIIGPRRLALIGAIAAVALTIIFYPLIIYTPADLGKVHVKLSKVEVLPSNETDEKVTVRPTFAITNNNDMTLTTSNIDFQLFANGQSIGSSSVSYEDVPIVGRPQIFTNTTVQVPGSLDYQISSSNGALFKMIRDNSSSINWSTKGAVTVETGTTLFDPKDFSDQLQK